MFTILKVKTPGEAWREAAKVVMSKGKFIFDGEKLLKEYLYLFIFIRKPLNLDKTIEKFGDKTVLEFMKKNFLKREPIKEWGYSYGSRIFNFNGMNQLREVVKKLKEKPESKSAVITLNNPLSDFNTHFPCLNLLDFKIRGRKKVFTTAFFRSQDVGKKIYADILALGEISKMVANSLKTNVGPLTLIIVSAHIYQEDFNKVNQLIKYGKN